MTKTRKTRREGGDEYAARTIKRDLEEPHGVDEVGDFLGCDLTTADDVERVVSGRVRAMDRRLV